MVQPNNNKKKFAIFVSGKGSFAKAVYNNSHLIKNGELVLIISDRKCQAYDFFNDCNNITAKLFEFNKYQNKESFEEDILSCLVNHNIDYVFLTYDRLLGNVLLNSCYNKKIFNLHPALLPMFKGIGAINKAYESSALFYGASVHLVDETVDEGPIIAQTVVTRNINHSKEIFTQKLFEKASILLIDSIYKVINHKINYISNKPVFENVFYSDDGDFNPKLSIDCNAVKL